MSAERARPSEILYDAVALGMWTYAHAAFRPRTLGGEGERFGPGLMLVSTHRADTDVPLICAAVFFRLGLWRSRRFRLHFAARDDLFERGFFAGVPPRLPTALRRLLYPVSAARGLPLVRVHPIRSAAALKVGQALAALAPETALEPLLPAAVAADLRARASDFGRRAPAVAGDVLRGEYADILWRAVSPDDLGGPDADGLRRRHAAAAAGDVRELVSLVRAREVLLLFPEGRPSPEGEIGPLRPGVGLLVRRGRPERLLPVGVAYDALVPGRPRAYVSFGQAFPPPEREVEATVLAALRRATPLTCGQVVGDRLVAAALARREAIEARDFDAALADEVAAARGENRHVEPGLLDVRERRDRLSEALRTSIRLGALGPRSPRRLEVLREPALADPFLRLAREYASARGRELTLSSPALPASEG